jgi:hypothetical protein
MAEAYFPGGKNSWGQRGRHGTARTAGSGFSGARGVVRPASVGCVSTPPPLARRRPRRVPSASRAQSGTRTPRRPGNSRSWCTSAIRRERLSPDAWSGWARFDPATRGRSPCRWRCARRRSHIPQRIPRVRRRLSAGDRTLPCRRHNRGPPRPTRSPPRNPQVAQTKRLPSACSPVPSAQESPARRRFPFRLSLGRLFGLYCCATSDSAAGRSHAPLPRSLSWQSVPTKPSQRRPPRS